MAKDYEYDYVKLKVGDIRQILVDEFEFDEEKVLEIKGKSALVELLQEKVEDAQQVDVNFGDDEDSGDFEEVDNSVTTTTQDVNEQATPVIGDFGWHDYVMGHFHKEELVNENPTVDGMRRVTEHLLGCIKSISTNMVQLPEQISNKDQQNNDRRATAIVTITLNDDSSFDGSADAYWGNNKDKPYCHYPVSIAETRAEGRALKRVLRLRKINAAEEIGATADQTLEPTTTVDDGFITDAQLRHIEVMCNKDRLNINVNKFIESMSMDTDNIKALTYANALILTKQLSAYQSEDIPTELVGYNTNWRT